MFMKKNRSLNLKYAGSQIFYFAAFAAMMGYASVFLLDKGCSNSQIGIALALSSIIAVLLQPMLASFADNHKNIEIRNIMAPIILVVIALSAILYLIPGSAFAGDGGGCFIFSCYYLFNYVINYATDEFSCFCF